MKRTKKLSAIVFLFFTLFAFLVVCLNTGFIYLNQRETLIDEQGKTIYSFARYFSEQFENPKDIQSLKHYRETLTKDDRYDGLKQRLTQIIDKLGVSYVYIFFYTPETSKVTALLDAQSVEAASQDLGFSYEIDLDDYPNMNVYLDPLKKPDDVYDIDVDEVDEEYNILLTSYSPIYDEHGNIVAFLGIDYKMSKILIKLNRTVLSLFLISIFSVLVFLFLAIYFIRKRVLKPVFQLEQTMNRFAKSNHDGQTPDSMLSTVKTGDELQSLSDTYNKMVRELDYYIDELRTTTMEQERTMGELKAAHTIQFDLLPQKIPPFATLQNVSCAADLKAALEVGGDLYDVIVLDDKHLALIIGDVSGKGVPAALFMAMTQTIQRSLSGITDPGKMVSVINKILNANNNSEMFVTYWMGVLNIETGIMQYTNAGHNPPLLKKADGAVVLLKERHCVPLAILPNLNPTHSETKLNDGDMLVCYTDGVTEAFNSDKELFGDDRLFDTVQKNSAASPSDMLKLIENKVETFANGEAQSDDITLLITKWQKPATKNDTLTIDATDDNFLHVMKFIKELPLDKKQVGKIMLATEEIYANIAHYAYPDKNGKVKITTKADGDMFKISFEDGGIPFNPLERAEPDLTTSAADRALGGMGIFLVKKTMDLIDYEYKDGKNILTIGLKID